VQAFKNCTNLKSIIIPDSVVAINLWAFAGCNNVTIYCEAKKKPAGWDKDWNVYEGGGLFKKHCKVVWGYKK
jgi:hypothetical protein